MNWEMQPHFPSLFFIAHSCYVTPFQILSTEHGCFLKRLIIQDRFMVPYLKATYSTSLASWIYVITISGKLIGQISFPTTPQQAPFSSWDLPVLGVSTSWSLFLTLAKQHQQLATAKFPCLKCEAHGMTTWARQAESSPKPAAPGAELTSGGCGQNQAQSHGFFGL